MKKHLFVLTLILLLSVLVSLTSCKDENETKHNHTMGEMRIENQTPASCTENGGFDTVVYCADCGEEMSRTSSTVPKSHNPGSAVKENKVDADCLTLTSYDEVVYCTRCDEELSRKKVTGVVGDHTSGEPVKENERAATCQQEGSYDAVVYCTVCNEVVSSTKISTEKANHTLTHHDRIYATAALTGTIEHWHCSVCFKDFSDEACENEVKDLTYDFIGIRTADDLKSMASNKKYALVNNIDLAGIEWTPLFADSTFTGTFDGNGHIISNLTITQDTDYTGFFANNSGTIQNLGLEDVTITINIAKKIWVGAIASANYGTIKQCYVSGNIVATSGYLCAYIGAIAGGNHGTISDCYSIGTVKAINSTNISGALAAAGGIIGINYEGSILNCYSTCNVSAEGDAIYNLKAAGIVTSLSDSNVSGCYSTGNITANDCGAITAVDYSTVNCYRSSSQTITAEYNLHTAEEAVDINTIKTVEFHADTLGWSEDIWSFEDGAFPTLKAFE